MVPQRLAGTSADVIAARRGIGYVAFGRASRGQALARRPDAL